MWCVLALLSNMAMASPSWNSSGKKKKNCLFFFSQTHETGTQMNNKLEKKFAVVVNQPQC